MRGIIEAQGVSVEAETADGALRLTLRNSTGHTLAVGVFDLDGPPPMAQPDDHQAWELPDDHKAWAAARARQRVA
jgi:hypothetical protein